jgi:2-oxoglutarate ferredoxin oxidoreductase subunit beta
MNDMTPFLTKPKDWETDQEVAGARAAATTRFLKAVQRTMPEIGARPENTVSSAG